MTPALFYVADLTGVVPGGLVLLDGQEGRHAAGSRRLLPGEELRVADGSGRWARCTVVENLRNALQISVVSVQVDPLPVPWVRVVQAVPKGDRADRAVETLTEVGADEIVPWLSERTIVRWDADRAERGRDRWARVARQAAKQCRRVRPPVVTSPVIGVPEPAGVVLVLHESAVGHLSGVDLSGVTEVTVVVGPEGGLTDGELAAWTDRGAIPVRLGREIVRSSTAGTAAVAVVNAMSGRW